MKREELWNAMEYLDDDLILAAGELPGRKGRAPLRIVLLAAILVILAATAVGAYVKWHLSQPETYTGDAVKPQSALDYTYEEETGHYFTPAGESSASDEEFLEQAKAVLTTIGGGEIDMRQMQLVHELDERWNRNQVRITFPQDEFEGEVLFDEATGYLIAVTRFVDLPETVDTPLTQAEALAAAQDWYERLPYCPGYVFSDVLQIADDAWMYSFSRQLETEIDGQPVSLQNYLEQVRITIDPRTGTFQLSNAFFVPLLDDHEATDVPISQEQAIAIAQQAAGIEDASTWTVSAQYTIAFPNWSFTEYMGVEPARRANVTRLAWTVTFSRPAGTVLDGQPLDFDEEIKVDVDLYTAEVLGGDMI